MSAAALDRLLAILVTALLVTGLLTLRAGSLATAPLFAVHGVLAIALVAATAVKLRRSVPRALRDRRSRELGLAAALTLAVGVALVGGLAWVASGRLLVVGPWTVLTLHVLAALVVVPLLVVHLLPKRWRLLRPSAPRGGARLSRRTLLAAGTLGVIGAAGWAVANEIDRLMGGVRRFTGSRWLPNGGVPPATTFFGEHARPIDAAGWRLSVSGEVQRELNLSLVELAALGVETWTEVLDCTSGWALQTAWTGIPLDALLGQAVPFDGARTVTVRSVTGWYARLGLDEAGTALLATHVAGVPLPAENGAPCRLVVRNRRGLEWVKWVGEVRVG